MTTMVEHTERTSEEDRSRGRRRCACGFVTGVLLGADDRPVVWNDDTDDLLEQRIRDHIRKPYAP